MKLSKQCEEVGEDNVGQLLGRQRFGQVGFLFTVEMAVNESRWKAFEVLGLARNEQAPI